MLPFALMLLMSAAAMGGGVVLSEMLGIDGQFLGVALGLTAYGLLVASAVRRGVWRAA